MKKIIALILALTLALCLCACGGSKTETPAATEAPKAEEAPKTEAPKTEAPKAEEPKAEEPAPEVKWPNGELTIYSGYQVGSLTDVNLHTIADWITKETGETVKIESNDTAGGATLALKLTKAKPDGQTIMAIGMNCISNFYNGTWEVNPSDSSKFKIVAGSIQPYPDSGCIILTQADSPYSSWQELAKYAEEHPGEVTVASIAGKVMDIKMKAIFNGTGVAKNIRWAPTKSAEATAALLGGQINCVMLDETTAVQYLQDGSCKAIINCRADEDWSDAAFVEEMRRQRVEYHDSVKELYNMKAEMEAEGKSVEDIARADQSVPFLLIQPAGTQLGTADQCLGREQSGRELFLGHFQ